MSLKSFLIRLILICVLPLVLLAGYLAIDSVHALKVQRDLEATNLAHNVVTALDTQIHSLISGLQVLATSSASGDTQRAGELYQEAQLFRKTFDSHVVLADTSKRMIFNTRAPFGSVLPSLPTVKGRSSAAAALATGQPAVGDQFIGPVVKAPLVSVAVPVIRDGRPVLLLLSITESARFQQHLDKFAIPPGWSATLLDGKGAVIARRSSPGMADSSAADGDTGRFVVKSTISPWSLLLEVPGGIYRAPVLNAMAVMGAALLGVTLVSVVGGMLASRRLARSVEALAKPHPAPDELPISEIEHVRSMLVDAAAARREAGVTLRRSEERYRSLVENAPVALLVNRNGRFEYVNPAAVRMFGAQGSQMILGRTPYEFFHPEFHDAMTDRIKIVLQGGRVPLAETRVVQLDGSERNVEVVATCFTDQLGPAIQVMMHDITDRVQAEAALRESEERLRLLGDNLPESYVYQYIRERDGSPRFVYLSAGVQRVHGVTRDDVLRDAWNLHQQIDPRQMPALAELEDASRQSMTDFRMELRMLRSDGEWRWLQISSRPRVKDGVVIWDGVATDVSERKRGEERIEHLNRVLRAVRTVDQLIVREQDPERLIQGICQLLVEHRGYSNAMIILTDRDGSPLNFAESGEGEDFLMLAEHLRRGEIPSCCRKEQVHDGVFMVTGLNDVCVSCPMYDEALQQGTMCLILGYDQANYGLMIVSLNRGQGGDAEEGELFSGLAGDVAFALYNIEQGKARLRVQEERDAIQAELRQAQKMEAIGQLAGGIAHDFNNMLSVIVGFTQIAMAGLHREEPLYKNLQQIEKAGQRSAELTRQLLAFSRKQVIDPKVINLNSVILDQRKMLCRLIGEDLDMDFAPADDLWNIRIDPSQVNQVLTNLSVNARDAIRGVGTVTISTANIALDAGSSKLLQLVPGDYVELCFADTGAGMDQETQERIFEPFFTTKGEGRGTGLGLATVYGIVKQNAGAIKVQSAPGSGTAFHLYFPRSKEASAQGPEHQQEPQLAGSETILVVEDEEQVLMLVRKVLEQYGYKVLTAGGPTEALMICDSYQGQIHLLLTDVVMPMMNGKELQAQVQRIKPGIRTLFMSGYTEDVIAHRGVINEGVEFLPKPFNRLSLAQKVRAVLDASCRLAQ